MRRIHIWSGNGSGAGKTTAAGKTADQVYSIANAIRGELQRIYPRYDWYRKDQVYKDTTRVPEYGKGATIRSVLTDYGQAKCDANPHYWVDILIKYLREADIVASGENTVAVDDIRKMCELEAFKIAFSGRVTHFHVNGVGAKEEKMFENDELAAVADYIVEW